MVSNSNHLHNTILKAELCQNGDPWKTTERPKIVKVFQQSPRSVKFAVSVEWLRKPLKDHWKTKNNFSSKIPVGPWRQLKVYWETNKTIERSLKDHLAYCQRSLKDQSRSLKDWPRPLKELWKTNQDPRENSERLTETAARILKERDNRDCRKIMERLIRPLKVHWEIAEILLKDHFPERPLKDCFEPFQKVLETTETVYSVVIFSHRFLDSDCINVKTFAFLAVYWPFWTSLYNTDIKVQQFLKSILHNVKQCL